MKFTWVSQHCVLKALLLMWSSPAALVKVKSSASRALKVSKSLSFHAVYHLRMSFSLARFCPPALALAGSGRATAPTSAQAPVASRFLRDHAMLAIVCLLFVMLSVRIEHTDQLVCKQERCNQLGLWLPRARREFSHPTIFLTPIFHTLTSWDV